MVVHSQNKGKIQGYHTANGLRYFPNGKQLSCIYQSASIWHIRCSVLGCGYLHGRACICMSGILLLLLARALWGNRNFLDPAREWGLALLGLSL